MPRAPAGQVALLHAGDFLAADRDASAGRVIDSRDQVEHRGLARARRPHDRDEAPDRHLYRHVVERADLELVAFVDSGHVFEIDCKLFVHDILPFCLSLDPAVAAPFIRLFPYQTS